MATSRVPAVIDALASTIASATAVTVIDGPEVTDAVPQEWVNVGYDGDPEGEFDATSNSQAWAGIGAKSKDETLSVSCAVVAILGEGDGWKPARDRVFTILAQIEDALRADPSLGLPPRTVAEVSDYQYFQEPTPRGAQARIPFTVSVVTRI